MFLRFFHYPGKSCLFILPGSIVGIAAVDVSLPDVSYLLINGDKWPVWGAPADINRVMRVAINPNRPQVSLAEALYTAEGVYERIVERIEDEQERAKNASYREQLRAADDLLKGGHEPA